MGLLSDIFDFVGDIFEFAFGWWLPEVEVGEKGVDIDRQGSDKAIPVIYGTRKVGAIKVHKYVTDTPKEAWNDLLHLIVVFAEGECDGLETLYFNGVESTNAKFNGGRLSGDHWFEYDFYTGADGQPASASAVSGIPNWTIDHKLDGLCYAYIVLQMPHKKKSKRPWKGEPQIQAVIRGKKVLDTRTGITAYSENPVMCLRDYLTNNIYGKALPSSFIDDAAFEYVADKCDVSVDSTITTTEYVKDYSNPGKPGIIEKTVTETVSIPRFTCNLLVDTSRDYIDNISEILSSFRGIVQDMTGTAKITYESTIDDQYGGATTQPVFTFTADDLVDGIDHDGGSIDDRSNLVEIRFPNKVKNYETDSVFYPAEGNSLRQQWLDEDGGKVQEKSIKTDSITTKAEALQMAEIVAKRSRFNRVSKITGMPWTIQVEVGDVVGLDSQMNGWTNKPFRVQKKKINEDSTVDFTLREHEDNVYPWSGETFDEIDGGTWLGDPDDIPPVENLTLTPDPTLSRTGTLTWTLTTENAWIRRYDVEIVRDSDSAVIFDFESLGKSKDIPLLDADSYTANVYSVSQTGSRSPSTGLAFTLAAPVQPDSLSIEARDWEIDIAPQLASAGLGTTFEYDIITGDGTGHTPTSKGSGATFTFTGLLPATEYTVYARTLNAYGESAWISSTVTTTATGGQTDYITDILDEKLDALDDILGGVDSILEEVAQDILEIGQRNKVEERVKEAEVERVEIINGLVDEYLETLNQETLPELNARLTTAEGELDTLNDTIIPSIDTRLTDAESDLTVLNDTTIPSINNGIADAEADIDTLNNITIPNTERIVGGIDGVVEGIAQDISEIFQRSVVDKNLKDAEYDLSLLNDRFPIAETDIKDDSISTPKLQANSVIALNILAGAITTDKMTVNSIGGDRIAVNTLGADRIVANSVTAQQIASATITGDLIAANTITAANIDALTITANEIASNAITSDKITSLSITSTKLASNSVNASKIVSNSITANEIAANTITAGEIAARSISADRMVLNSITAAEIAALSITAGEIAARTISADKIVLNSLTADEIAANTITANEISAGTITTNEIAALTIAAGDISADAVTTDKIAALAITADKIAANTITADKIAANTISADEIVSNVVFGVDATFSGSLSAATGTFSGTVQAENIIGEQAAGATTSLTATSLTSTPLEVVSFNVSSASIDRVVIIPSLWFIAAGGADTNLKINVDFKVNGGNLYHDGLVGQDGSLGYFSSPSRSYFLSAGSSATFSIEVSLRTGSDNVIMFGQPYSPTIFKPSSDISFN